MAPAAAINLGPYISAALPTKKLKLRQMAMFEVPMKDTTVGELPMKSTKRYWASKTVKDHTSGSFLCTSRHVRTTKGVGCPESCEMEESALIWRSTRYGLHSPTKVTSSESSTDSQLSKQFYVSCRGSLRPSDVTYASNPPSTRCAGASSKSS